MPWRTRETRWVLSLAVSLGTWGMAMNAPAQAAGIANECLSAEMTDTGALSRIDNLLAGEVYRINADTFAVVTDRGLLSNRDATPAERDVAPGRARYVFRNGDLYDVVMEYTLKPGRRYLERRVALAANQFLGPYLDYPLSPPVEQLAGPEATPEGAPEAIYDRPVDPNMPPRVPSGAGPKERVPVVTWVDMSPPFLREGQTTVFSAKVDLPPEELESVTLSAPGGDAPMRFDAKSGNWVFAHRPGGRAGLIMDVPSYHVWAAAKNGMVSHAREIPLQWRFK